MRGFFLVLIFGLVGCAVTPSHKVTSSFPLTVSTFALEPFLDSPEEQSLRAQNFINRHSHITEREKIAFLLEGLRSSHLSFVRNGEVYTGEQAADWFRWKMHRPKYGSHPIVTARDFVDRVCAISNTTGRPYEVVTASGERSELHPIMSRELNALEQMIIQKEMTAQMLSIPSNPAAAVPGTSHLSSGSGAAMDKIL